MPEEEQRRPVLIGEEKVELVFSEPRATSHTLLAVIGAAIVAAGFFNLLLLWLPPAFGAPAWVFGTVGETLDSAPALGLGIALLSYGIVRHPETDVQAIRALAASFVVLGAALFVSGLLYAIAIPAVLAEAPEMALSPVRRSIVKAGGQLTIYIAACAGVSTLLRRSLQKP